MGDVVMNDKINVMGIDLDCITAKEAMLRVMGFFKNESVNLVEVLSMDVLMAGMEDHEWHENVKKIEIVLPGDVEILKAAKTADRLKMRETQNDVFQKLLIKYIEKNKMKIFLLGENEQDIVSGRERLTNYAKNIKIIGQALLAPDGSEEEKVINDINGTEADCIFSVLRSPYQEAFIIRNRALISAKVWFGCSMFPAGAKENNSGLRKLRHFFIRRMFFRRVEKQNN